jgi:hypothetical protein
VTDEAVPDPRGDDAPAVDAHRRRAAHLYGLIVSGAVLAATPDSVRLVAVAIALFATLVVYWVAETYVHWIAARSHVRRDLTGPERSAIVRDGWPLVAACVIPVTVLAVESVLQVDTPTAVRIALGVNAILLLVVGWDMSRASGLTGVRLVLSTAVTGLLGVAMIVLKTLLH